jgi:hypothetical protein
MYAISSQLDRAFPNKGNAKGYIGMNVKEKMSRDKCVSCRTPRDAVLSHGDASCVAQYAESDRCRDSMPRGCTTGESVLPTRWSRTEGVY